VQHPFGHDVVLHPHTPVMQAFPAAHTLPHAPQLLPSDCSSTHAVPQSVYGSLHAIPHAVPLHVAAPYALPFVGPGHGVSHAAPQLVTAVLLSHVPLQSCVPAGHAQLPA
jgi:hypothetical protein